LALLGSGCASTSFPEVSDDGLVRVWRTPNGAIYEAPDLDVRDYGEVVVDACTVSFRDDWQRDQNRDRGPARRVTADDMQRIAQELADMCHEIFAAELTEITPGGGDAPDDAGTLTVRPAIVDLDIAAPDLQTPGRERTYVTSSGQMTLNLELVDTSSGRVVGRVIDRRQAMHTTSPRRATVVSNRNEAELILGQWATVVRDHLETSVD
jgi:hypothetical protein